MMISIEHQGQRLELHDFRLRWTYEGYLAGSREKISALIRKELLGQVQRIMPDCGTPIVLDDGDAVLPEYLCMALLFGPSPARRPDADGGRIFLCWFIDKPTSVPQQIVKAALDSVCWEAHAEPFFY